MGVGGVKSLRMGEFSRAGSRTKKIAKLVNFFDGIKRGDII